jgi:hypothetical protein
MTPRLFRLLALCAVTLTAACSSDTTSPSDAALDGAWTSGTRIDGLGFGLNLTWTGTSVRGTGTYATFNGPAPCGNEIITGSGTLELYAVRTSSSNINGTLTFGTVRVNYQATLTADHPGYGNLDGFMTATDGTVCPLSIFEGLIP